MVPYKQRAQNWDIRTRNSQPELHGQFVQPSAWECLYLLLVAPYYIIHHLTVQLPILVTLT